MSGPGVLDFRIGEVRFQMLTLDPDFEPNKEELYLRHQHQCFELHYVYRGKCVFGIRDGECCVQKGEICLIPPGFYHSNREVSSDLGKLCIGFGMEEPVAGYSDEESRRLEKKLLSQGVFSCAAGTLEPMLEQIRSMSRREGWDLVAREQLKAMLILLLSELSRQIGLLPHKEEAGRGKAGDIRRNFLIEEFFCRDFNLRDGDRILADKLSVSSRHLDRILKSLYGKSYREKLMEIRLEVSIDLLNSTNISIAEISELVGYSAPANFSAFIKSTTGMTPTQIRQMKRTRCEILNEKSRTAGAC